MEAIPGIEVRPAAKEELGLVRELAQKIFPVTYENIVEDGQVDYMMTLFYTPEALVSQLESGQIFLIIYYEKKPAGFASYTCINADKDFKLNKLYLDYGLQGKGLGKCLLRDVISRVKTAGGRSLRLNVNRHNKAVGFYKNMGFSVLKEELLDIGGGHYMDDYVMELNLIQP
jgi:ribosomal protein S18 acetylase RimI-like enzyme